MVHRALACGLGGAAEVAYGPKGIVFTAEAPLPDPRAPVGTPVDPVQPHKGEVPGFMAT